MLSDVVSFEFGNRSEVDDSRVAIFNEHCSPLAAAQTYPAGGRAVIAQRGVSTNPWIYCPAFAGYQGAQLAGELVIRLQRTRRKHGRASSRS